MQPERATLPRSGPAYRLTAEGAAACALADLTALLAAGIRADAAWRIYQTTPATLDPILADSLRRDWCAAEAALAALLEGV